MGASTMRGSAEVDRELAAHVRSGAAPGAVALIAVQDEVHLTAVGSMHVDGPEPMREDTLFRMASASKPVTAAAVMALVEEGRLRLDDAVERWLPELADRRVLRQPDGPLTDTEPARRPITVRDLLTFTWGFGMVLAPPDTYPIQTAIRELGIGSDGTSPSALEPDEWLRRLGGLPLMRQPGEQWLYNTGSDVLGLLVSRVAGRSFGEFSRERIFEPLGMVDTGFSVPAGQLHRLPTSYAHDPERGGLVVWDEVGGKYSSPPAFEVGGDGLVSTARDFHAFFHMLLDGGRGPNGRVLSAESVHAMTTDQLTPAQQAEKSRFPEYFGDHGGFGFGMGVRTVPRGGAGIGQFGWDGGLGTSVQADPTLGLIGVLLTQVAQDTPDTPRLIAKFWDLAYRAAG